MPPTNPEVYLPNLSARSTTDTTPATSKLNEYTSHLQTFEAAFASRASNAADDLQMIAVIPENMTVVSAWMMPSASQAGSATNFDDVKIVNIGSAGTGTTVLASKTFSAAAASIAAGAPGSMALGTALNVDAGQVIGVSRVSQGNGIPLVAHSIGIAYRLR